MQPKTSFIIAEIVAHEFNLEPARIEQYFRGCDKDAWDEIFPINLKLSMFEDLQSLEGQKFRRTIADAIYNAGIDDTTLNCERKGPSLLFGDKTDIYLQHTSLLHTLHDDDFPPLYTSEELRSTIELLIKYLKMNESGLIKFGKASSIFGQSYWFNHFMCGNLPDYFIINLKQYIDLKSANIVAIRQGLFDFKIASLKTIVEKSDSMSSNLIQNIYEIEPEALLFFWELNNLISQKNRQTPKFKELFDSYDRSGGLSQFFSVISHLYQELSKPIIDPLVSILMENQLLVDEEFSVTMNDICNIMPVQRTDSAYTNGGNMQSFTFASRKPVINDFFEPIGVKKKSVLAKALGKARQQINTAPSFFNDLWTATYNNIRDKSIPPNLDGDPHILSSLINQPREEIETPLENMRIPNYTPVGYLIGTSIVLHKNIFSNNNKDLIKRFFKERIPGILLRKSDLIKYVLLGKTDSVSQLELAKQEGYTCKISNNEMALYGIGKFNKKISRNTLLRRLNVPLKIAQEWKYNLTPPKIVESPLRRSSHQDE